MLATRQNIVHYLVGENLLSKADLLDDLVQVFDQGSRHRNFYVYREKGQDYFVKQGNVATSDRGQSVRREAVFYAYVNANDAFAAIKSLMPELHKFDRARNIVILEGLSESEDLHSRRLRLGLYPEVIGAYLGNSLAKLHAIQIGDANTLDEKLLFRRKIPTILTYALVNPRHAQTEADLGLIFHAINQSPILRHGMAEIRGAWEAKALIHGDLKGPNFLLTRTDNAEQAAHSLRFVDWELVDKGDRCWDIGAVFHDTLQSLLFSQTQSNNQSEGLTVDDLQAPMQAFWAQYISQSSFETLSAQQILVKSMQCAAARLVQTAFEDVAQQKRLNPYGHSCLQLAEYLFQDPGRALQSYFRLA